MKHIKLIMLFCIGGLFIAGKSFGQANPFINVLPSNSGIVTTGATIDIIVTIGNTGPVSAVPQAKLRPIIQVPSSVAFLSNAQQTGLPSGWTILTNTGTQLRLCNSSDPIPVNTSRIIILKVQGVTVAAAQTFSGNINFGNGTTCAAGPSVSGDQITDNSATSTIEVVPGCNLGVTATADSIVCHGDNTTITCNVTSATGPIEYNISGNTNWQASNIFTVPAGTYTLTAREVNNPIACTTNTSISITQPALISTSSSAAACDSYTWSANGVTYTASGTYSYTSLNVSGCMNTASLNLTIKHTSTGNSSITTCNTYVWNGITYTTSGTLIHTYVNAASCDSVHTLQLTINYSTFSNLTVSSINSYTWPASGLTYTSSGTYSYTSVNAAGCDSIMSLNLTIYQSAVNMTLQNVVQISPSVFEYDIMLTNTGNTALALKGYSCGINHAVGMRNGGTLTHTFVSRDPSLAAIPNPVAGYTSSSNHLRITAANTTNGNEINLSPGLPIRIATMRVSNSVPFPADFIPSLALQTLTAVGKTACVANCIVTPPGTLYTINGVGNTPATGFIQGLTGVVNTPCLYLNKTANFAASMSQSSPVSCYGQSNGVAQISSSGTGSSSTGMYSINGGAMTAYASNPFTISNLAAATYTVALTSSNGCVSSSTSTITQSVLSTTATSVTACNSYTWQGVTYTASGSATNTFISAAGCDSIHTKNFLINYSDASSSSIVACGSYNWNGISYTTSGIYIQTYTNSTGCDSTLTLNLTVNPIPSPSISASGSLTFCDGMSIVLNANIGSDLTYQWKKNGISILGATSNSYTASQSGSYTVEETNSSNCSAVSSPQVVTVNNCNVSLQLKLFIQGYYDQASTMLPVLLNQLVSTDNTLTDTILVELHNALYPFDLALSKKAVLHTNGSAVCTFNYVNGNYYLGNLYYVAIRHRNGLLTWSANPIAFDSTTVVYDFSSLSSKAYGDNMLEVEPGVWAMYSADLNQDQNVDLLDMPILEADIAEYMFGYAATDLNGDGNTDLLDVIYMDYGIANYLFSMYPVAATLPTVSTNAISSITYTTASSGGSISNNGGATITARGVCWSTSSNPTIALSTKTIDGSGIGSFTSSITGLVAGTTYYVRAYAINSVGTSYGNEVVFTTTAFTLATLTTTAISNIDYTTASSGGIISSDGGATVTARGVCWSTSPNPTVSLSTKTLDGIGSGSFTSSITGLQAGTTYYVRAYATNSVGTVYGSQVVFTATAFSVGQSYQGGIIAYILQAGDPGYDANVVRGLIAAPSDQSTGIVWWNGSFVLTGATAKALGTGNANTNTIVYVQGVGSYAAKLCYDLVLNGYSDWYLPSKYELNKLYLNQAAIGGFAVADYWSSSEYNYNNSDAWMQGFGNGGQGWNYKDYPGYVRAVRAFRSIPSLSTMPVSSITATSSVCGGIITNDGGGAVIARGVCWSTSPNPTVSLSTKTVDGSGSGSFTSSITGLVAATTYYVRAYATNSMGESYGIQEVFTTNTLTPTLPTLATTAISAITNFTASCGGSISLNGVATVTARGVCWSTSSNPTAVLSTKTIDGSGIGSFTSSITGLLAGTTYYVRAYATNSVGTAYGNQVVFTSAPLAIGQSYQGGKVAYILQAGDPGYDSNVQHGLIAAPSDQSTGIVWGSYVTIGETDEALGTGYANTNTIVSVQGAGSYAAKICYDLVLNGYSDWYLPSRDELNKLYLNQTAIGGFAAAFYWSSSEVGTSGAWGQFPSFGGQVVYGKDHPGYVRAVRAF